ncbi:MAG TPA: histidine kinase, partial [Bacteroidia bacterium]|nr:histidine kinase [Bacteroidia bacterium]
NTLVLNTKNKIHKLNNIKEIISGVGLENTKKRLEIQYKNKYSLISTETSGIYEVNLKLEL